MELTKPEGRSPIRALQVAERRQSCEICESFCTADWFVEHQKPMGFTVAFAEY